MSLTHYFPLSFSCASCDCDSAGTVGGAECDVTTGECNCKQFVTGETCNMCESGYQRLDAANPFGCSAGIKNSSQSFIACYEGAYSVLFLFHLAPDEQGPPTASLLLSTVIELTWQLPEVPNGVILGYQLYRNGSNIANITETMYNDTGLTPNSYYSYFIVSYNVISSTTSAQTVFKTLEGVPTGLSPPTYRVLNSTAVDASWMEPAASHGTVSNYNLLLVQTDEDEEVFRGFAFSYIVTNLRPFTTYSFIVQACTSGGCGSSNSSQVRTEQAPPTSQPAPNISSLSDTELLLQWDAPTEPNGIIIRYEVFQREAPFQGNGMLIQTVDGSTHSLVVDGLQPFTIYQFRVESHTQPGGTPSEWSEGRTGEAGK